LSSAILYVAIVAIWGCVLIPRWLRRDSSASSPAEVQAVVETDGDVPGEADEEPAPSPRRPGESGVVTGRRSAPGERRDARDDQDHRRLLSARRRLLLLLVALTLASGALAGTRLAAWWVIIPPSVMLLGYLVLLRAAGKADAEWRELARTRGRAQAVRTTAAPLAVSSAAPLAAPLTVSAARPEVLTLSGSRASGSQHGEQIYDQYADAKLRAVGD
jgi:hypothetical protein